MFFSCHTFPQLGALRDPTSILDNRRLQLVSSSLVVYAIVMICLWKIWKATAMLSTSKLRIVLQLVSFGIRNIGLFSMAFQM
jgi:hypothetical protein